MLKKTISKVYRCIIFLILISCQQKAEYIDKKNNVKVEYFKTGEIKTRVELDDNIEHGNYSRFYQNGDLAESGIKIRGKKNGLWKYYDTLGLIKSAVHYYEDSLVYNLDVEDFKFNPKKIDNDLTIEIPKNWEIINNINEKNVLLTIRKKCSETIFFCPNLTIAQEKSFKTNDDIEVYLKLSDNILSSNFSNYRVIKERKYLFNKIIYFEKIYVGSAHNISIGGITTWIFKENKTYVITGLALNEHENTFLKYEGLFKNITDNIKIKGS